MHPLAITCPWSDFCGKQTVNRISLGSTRRDRQVPGSNKMLSPKSALRLWVLLLTPGTSGIPWMSDLGAGRLERTGAGYGEPRGTEGRGLAISSPPSCFGVDKTQTEWSWAWPGPREWLGLVPSVSSPCILWRLVHPLSQVLKLLHQSQCWGEKYNSNKNQPVHHTLFWHRGTWPHGGFCWSCQRNPFHLRLLLWTWAYTKYLHFNK